MRTRSIAAIVLLLLPAVAAGAQRPRLPTVGRRGGAAPAEMPRQPAAIAQALAYRRSKLSVESYPLITHMSSAGILTSGAATSWTSVGAGTRASYRLGSMVAATMDMTSSPFNGIATTETAELGARVGPEFWDHKVHPFVDARVGYMRAYDGYFQSGGNPNFVGTGPGVGSVRFSQGAGVVAGIGMDRSVTRQFSVTLATSVMRSRLDARDTGASGALDGRYWMTAYRYTVGLRFNPVRAVNSTQRGAR